MTKRLINASEVERRIRYLTGLSVSRLLSKDETFPRHQVLSRKGEIRRWDEGEIDTWLRTKAAMLGTTIHDAIAAKGDLRWLTLAEAAEMAGIDQDEVLLRARHGAFPAARRITQRKTLWINKEIAEWKRGHSGRPFVPPPEGSLHPRVGTDKKSQELKIRISVRRSGSRAVRLKITDLLGGRSATEVTVAELLAAAEGAAAPRLQEQGIAGHLRRAASAGLPATLTRRQWRKTVTAFLERCAYCAGEYEALEHVVPISRGGGTTALNCVPACTVCNTTKKDRSPDDLPAPMRERAHALLEWLREIHGTTTAEAA